MKCPYCNKNEDKVIDSRSSTEGDSIRRRRECIACAKRFTTYEYIEATPLMVVKRDGARQSFDRERLKTGLIKACEKRSISMEKIDGVVNEIERALQEKAVKEIKSTEIGNMVMAKLYDLDEVAYVRFASVYRRFKDVTHFMDELKHFLDK
jgi:transcriptional repressor NrdR